MTTIDLSKLHPWDLTLIIGGQKGPTAEPTLEVAKKMAAIEAELLAEKQSRDPDAERTCELMRSAVALMLQDSSKALADDLGYADTMAAYTGVVMYYADFIKKKQEAATAAARATAGADPAASTS